MQKQWGDEMSLVSVLMLISQFRERESESPYKEGTS